MSTPTPVSISEFGSAVDNLNSAGKNWVTFQCRFIMAVKQKHIFRHFDGTDTKPTLLSPATETETKALTAWQEKEDTAMYLLSQKLADSTLTKYTQKDTVVEMWSAIILEFMQKSMLVCSNMHLKFMAMHYTSGANLHAELDRVHVEYETLLNADVAVTDNDYHTLVINFLPSHLASFVAQISANTKAITMVQHAASSASAMTPTAPLDPKLLEMSPESMMTLALEEYDRQADKKTSKPKDTGVAASMMASEKPGSRTGGGKGGKGKGPQKPKGVCWNCAVRATSYESSSLLETRSLSFQKIRTFFIY
jgi:hypothetical protein